MSGKLEGKDRFDALSKLSDQAWRDWDHKARYQWKLSFGIWGALLAGMSLVLSEKVVITTRTAIFVCLSVFLIHYYFMSWVEMRIRDFRHMLYEYMEQMESMADVSSATIEHFRSILDKQKNYSVAKNKVSRFFYRLFIGFNKPAAGVHLLITFLLTWAFYLAIQGSKITMIYK